MTTVQVPKAFVRMLPKFQVHRRQPFYEILMAGVRGLSGPVPDAGSKGEKPP